MAQGIKRIDLHGLNLYKAKIKIDSELRRAGKDIYVLRFIHGFNGGTEIKDSLITYKDPPKGLREKPGSNRGETDLALREP